MDTQQTKRTSDQLTNVFQVVATISLFALAIFLGFDSFFGTTEPYPEPNRIQRQFNNGRVIDMEVDRTISRDNWECTGDCSGHEAGYEWAEENGVIDPSDCGGNSESFIEGCMAYANEN